MDQTNAWTTIKQYVINKYYCLLFILKRLYLDQKVVSMPIQHIKTKIKIDSIAKLKMKALQLIAIDRKNIKAGRQDLKADSRQTQATLISTLILDQHQGTNYNI